jgi:hypothetical protein
MKWKNRKLFNVSHITLVGKTREEPFTSQVWASSEEMLTGLRSSRWRPQERKIGSL